MREKLGLREPPPSPSSPDLAELLRRADNFDAILQDVLKNVEPRWRQEDLALTPKQVALFDGFRSGEFVTSPLQFSTAAAGRGALLVNDQRNHVPLLHRDTRSRRPSRPRIRWSSG